MIIKAEQKYLRTSARKLRLVADMVREIGSPRTALEYLVHIDKRAALPLVKVLKQAMANAKNNAGIKEDELKIKEITVNEGPFYKRFRPVSRGRAHSIKKRTSHIRVVLEEVLEVSKVPKVPQVSQTRTRKEDAQG